MNALWTSTVEINDPRLTNIDRYKELAAAIVLTAAHDYLLTLRYKQKRESKRIEKFFRSPNFELFTNSKIDPEYLIKKLRNMSRHGQRGVKEWAH